MNRRHDPPNYYYAHQISNTWTVDRTHKILRIVLVFHVQMQRRVHSILVGSPRAIYALIGFAGQALYRRWVAVQALCSLCAGGLQACTGTVQSCTISMLHTAWLIRTVRVDDRSCVKLWHFFSSGNAHLYYARPESGDNILKLLANDNWAKLSCRRWIGRSNDCKK